MSEDKPKVDNLTPSELQNELQTWSGFHGKYEEMKNGMPFYRITHYPTAMNALVLRLIDIGYSEEQIRSDYLSSCIQRFCTSHRHANRKSWMFQIGRHWDFAVNARFPATTEAMEAKPLEGVKATTHIDVPEDNLAPGLRRAKDGRIIKDYEEIELSEIKGLIEAERIVVDNDPLAFLKKEKNE